MINGFSVIRTAGYSPPFRNCLLPLSGELHKSGF